MRASATAGVRVGLEHEYRVCTEAGPVDFQGLIHELGFDGVRVDPADPNAYRLPWGGVVTCDGPEAEIAIPPVRLAAGFTGEVARLGRLGRRTLAAHLPAGHGLDGYSTHLSVSAPRRREVRTAHRYAQTCGAALMLLMDQAHSPGLLVRPRPGRLELCGEHTHGMQLEAATAFAAATTLALRDPATRRRLGRLRLDVTIAPATHRFGWYVDRHAFGVDLYTDGREALLRRVRGGTITAQDHLEAVWEHTRPALASHVHHTDLAVVDAVIDGRLPLPLEDPYTDVDDLDEDLDLDEYRVDLRDRHREPFTVRTTIVSWDFAVFTITDPANRQVFVNVPAALVGEFLEEIDTGAADHDLLDALAEQVHPRLERPAQTTTPGIYSTVGDPGALLPPERDPGTGRRIRAGGGGRRPRGRRPGKREDHQQHRPPRPTRALIAAGTGIAAITIAAVIAVAALAGGGSGDSNSEPRGADATSTGTAAPEGKRATPPFVQYTGYERTSSVHDNGNLQVLNDDPWVHWPKQNPLVITCTRDGCALTSHWGIDDEISIPVKNGIISGAITETEPPAPPECPDFYLTTTYDLRVTGSVDRDGIRFPKTLTGTITLKTPSTIVNGLPVCRGGTDVWTVNATATPPGVFVQDEPRI